MINLISSVVFYKNRFLIGKKCKGKFDLLFKLKDDMVFFRNITTNSKSNQSKLDYNVVLVGRNTYYSICDKYRPLKNRLNLVLTNDKKLQTSVKKIEADAKKFPKNVFLSKEYFISFETFKEFYKKYLPNVFVIGGASVFDLFLNEKPSKLYITEINSKNKKDIDECNDLVYFKDTLLSSEYKMVGYSEKFKTDDCDYRVLFYERNIFCKHSEDEYLNLARDVLYNGTERKDRTGTGVMSVFSRQLRFDLQKSFPLLTTKRVPFKTVFEELLWFCRGDTDAKILKRKGIKIWDGNTSRDFLDRRGLDYNEGVLGAGYGWQIRHQGGEYKEEYADSSKIPQGKQIGFDQLKYIEDLLRNDPYSRRIMMSYWNPSDFHKTALQPCHFAIQFYVEEVDNVKYLSGHFNMRSSDTFLGLPFNIASYGLLVEILAKKCGMIAKELVYTGGDVHVYLNHIVQMNEQISRSPRPLPMIHVNESIIEKDWKDIVVEDIELIGYFPHPTIKADMAV